MGALGDLFGTILFTAVLCIPLGLSMWALLDAARRPSWAWSLSGRSQAVWIAAILFGMLVMILGLIVAPLYLVRIRHEVEAAEEGRITGT
ncbi:MAG: hypothetical protein MUF83_11650 [Acidimicrobiales bacterium]|nr:hypothetical protein [Acidimicrobiales bacterium]